MSVFFNTLKLVGMYPEQALVPISEASSGQKQRIAFARALILEPEIIIADDTINSLDFSVKTQLINLMLCPAATRDCLYLCGAKFRSDQTYCR